MSQPNPVPWLILCYKIATVTPGYTLGLQGQILKWPNVAPGTSPGPLGLFPMPIKYYLQLFDTANGAACTYQPQVCDDGATWVSWGAAVTLTATAALSISAKRTGVVKNAFFRINVTAISGTAPKINAYAVVGSTP